MKDILVPLDTSESCLNNIDAALAISAKFNSHVTGFYQERNINYALYGENYSAVIMNAFDQQLEQERNRVKQLLDSRTIVGDAKCDLKIEKAPSRNDVFSYASVCDLVVCGQPEPENTMLSAANHAESIVMGSGKPVLIVPYIGFKESMGSNVMIAWDKSREASRAVQDAIPLLKQANSVHIFSAVSRKEAEQEIAGAELAEHLSRHDINVIASPTVLADITPAEALLSRSADLGIDLIVMGAYGHSRLREYTLGGTTRTMLQSMTLPVLMTH